MEGGEGGRGVHVEAPNVKVWTRAKVRPDSLKPTSDLLRLQIYDSFILYEKDFLSLFIWELMTKLRELTTHVKFINVRCERIVCYPGTLANLIEMVFSGDDT